MVGPLYRLIRSGTYGVLCGPRRYRYLFKTIRRLRPATIMEIGTWRGARAVQMIDEAQKFRPASEITYYGFDLFEEMTEAQLAKEVSKRPPTQTEVESRLLATGVASRLYKGDTTRVLPRVLAELPQMDFVFIDGGHSIETIRSDWENVEALMHERTVVIFDDYWRGRIDAGAKPTVDGIDRSRYDVEVLPRVDTFTKEWGRLEIQFARVRRKAS